MKSIIESISHWELLDIRKRIDQLKESDTPRRPARLVIGDRLSPLDLYVYLKARFGPPNGMQMAFRASSSDNMFHWHYTINASNGAILEIWQSNLLTEIFVEGISPPTNTEWDQLISAIQTDFKKYGPSMSNVRCQLEHWHLFVNPYKRLYDVLERCRNDLTFLDINCTDVPTTPETPEELREFVDTPQQRRSAVRRSS